MKKKKNWSSLLVVRHACTLAHHFSEALGSGFSIRSRISLSLEHAAYTVPPLHLYIALRMLIYFVLKATFLVLDWRALLSSSLSHASPFEVCRKYVLGACVFGRKFAVFMSSASIILYCKDSFLSNVAKCMG